MTEDSADLSRAAWRKSSYSGSNGGQCVEVAPTPTPARLVAVRDSKDSDGPNLLFTPAEWAVFITAIKGAH